MKNAIKGILQGSIAAGLLLAVGARGADPAPPRASSPTKTTTPATTIIQPTSPTRASTQGGSGLLRRHARRDGRQRVAPVREPRRRRSSQPGRRSCHGRRRSRHHHHRRRSCRRRGRQGDQRFHDRTRSGWSGHPGSGTGGRRLCGAGDGDAEDWHHHLRRVGLGVNIVFSGCQLSGGAPSTERSDVQITRSASDTTCGSATTITLGYTSTITNLTYTGTGGAKIVIPNEMSTSTLTYSFGQAPTTASIQTNGEIQRFASGGSMTTDRTYTGT